MKKTKISMILNIIIVLVVIFALVSMYTGFKFMDKSEVILESTRWHIIKYFTIDSNLFMGIIALIFAYYDYILLKKEIKEIPRIMYILKLMATTGVGLTFVVIFGYLGFIAPNGIISLLLNSNLFLHLIIPVLSMITFMFFEKSNKLNRKDVWYGLIPMGIYAIYYVSNVLIHMQHGKISPEYDWYWFFQNGVWTMVIVFPIVVLLTYGISYLLWRVNKEK